MAEDTRVVRSDHDRRLREQARRVSRAAAAEGWLTLAADRSRLSSLQQAIAELAELVDAIPGNDAPVVTVDLLFATLLDLRSDEARSTLMRDLAPLLTGAQLARAWTVAQHVSDQNLRSYMLLTLAPHLPADLLAQTPAVAAGLTAPLHRGTVLAALVPLLAADQRAETVTAALATLRSFPAYARGPLIGMAPWMTADQLTMAMRILLADPDTDRGAVALASLAPYLPPAQRDEAIAAVVRIEDEALRALTFVTLAPQMEDGQCRALVAVAHAITEPGPRSHALAGIAAHLPNALRPEVVSAAVTAVVDSAGRDSSSHHAVRDLASMLDAARLDTVLAALVTTASPSLASTMAELAPYLSADQLDGALMAALKLGDLDTRLDLVATLVPHLSDDYRTTLIAQMVTVIASQPQFASDLEAWAPYLTQEQITQVVEIITDEVGMFGIERLMPYLDAGQLDRVLAAVLDIEDEEGRCRRLMKLASRLGPDRVDRALRTVVEPGNRTIALLALAASANGGVRATALAEARRAAGSILDPEERARTLMDVAEHLPAGQLGNALSHAYVATTHLLDEEERATIMGKIAKLLN